MAEMSIFSSTRERKLWAWTAAVITAIYASLGLAGTMAGFLQRYAVVEPAFALGVLLVAAVIVSFGAGPQRSGGEIAVFIGVLAVYLLLLVRMATMAERTHVIEYGVVGILIYGALTERKLQGKQVPVPALIAVFATAFLGAIDELLQLYIPSRVFDPWDILVNVIAGSLAIASSIAISWAKRVGASRT